MVTPKAAGIGKSTGGVVILLMADLARREHPHPTFPIELPRIVAQMMRDAFEGQPVQQSTLKIDVLCGGRTMTSLAYHPPKKSV